MTKIKDLIAEVKTKHHLTSNYQLAKKTGIAEKSLNHYVNGHVQPDEYALTILALELEREPIEIIAEVKAETDKTEEKRQFWRNFLTRAACTGASVVVLGFGLLPGSGYAKMTTASSHATYSEIMRNALKRAMARVRRAFNAPILGVSG